MTELMTLAIPYEIDGEPYEGWLVFHPGVTTPRPGLLMAPNWMGIGEGAFDLARQAAGRDKVVFVADIYGRDLRPKSADEAGAAMAGVKQDPALLRRRMQAALEVLRGNIHARVAPSQLAAFGFCFGGHCALELARSGAPLQASVSFHGTLDTADPRDARNIEGAVLVLHGASDPLVPNEQLSGFAAEMTAAGVDWQLLSYGGAVHSFTDPAANVPGLMQYDRRTAHRAFAAMQALLDEVFQD
ncbi:dienelactone hydrolase family protein [Metapseudomonas furukawaii]|uniref:dienelactone hydrolase family protein n=1 Tax=Metapseudomonas furukawaii TaxID=1149133 RepID=UPI0040465B51